MARFVTKRKVISWCALTVVGFAFDAASYNVRHSAEQRVVAQNAAERQQQSLLMRQKVVFSAAMVPAQLPFTAILHRLGIDPATAAQIAASAQSVFDLRRVHAGNELAIGRSVMGTLRAIRYRIDTDRVLLVSSTGSDFHSEIKTIPSHTELVGVTGQIQDSLFDAVTNAGEKPELALRLADIFGWDLDFYTDPRVGDTFRVVVEKKILANGEFGGYGRVLAAEYNNDGRAYGAVLFHDPAGNPAYYTPDGKSMKKAFLHSPLKFAARITSHFSLSRYHPILKIYRPHLGTDYAAPTGTPVQAVGDGRVIYAGRKGEDGNLVEIRHANSYTTYYMHLSRVLVRDGQQVQQGQSIGLVGMTGLATGPHLDFRIERHGQFLNFERLPLPPSQPVAKSEWAEFTAARDADLAQMPPLPSEQTTTAKLAPSAPSPLPGH
ncbi:MAG TPA: peptidoglycan DD-metalloendopeptidase family protein [Candidatus Acidoferrum sp.]|nr:peptidoglycan DD-metalloendopeptidase family protein [Candidatus Acidoferrum sp.]